MSIKVMSHVWEHSKQKGAALLLLLALADMSDENGDCFPSTDYLARKARVDERSAQRTIAKLIQEGELIVFEKQGTPGHTGQKTNLYRLVLTTIEAALAIPIPQRGGKNVTTANRPIKIRKQEVTKVSPPSSPKEVVETSPDPSFDPPVKDQKQKEVVVARDIFFHPVFLEVVQSPKSIPLPFPVPPSDEQAAAEIITFYTETFGQMPTPTLLDQVKDALVEFGASIIRDAMSEAKISKPDGFVSWNYLDKIMQRLKRQAGQPKADPLQHWLTFKRRWHELTQVDLPDPATPYLVRRFKEADEALTHLGATEADVRALVDAKISEERYDYRFDYAGADIVPIITKRKAPRQSTAPGWKPIIVSSSSDETMTPEQRAAAVRQGRQQRQQAQRAAAERRRALEGEPT